jgi:DNA-binding response OmpR family regulator
MYMSEESWPPRIMIIEDNRDVNAYIAGLLVLKGITVHKTHSYDECIRTLEKLNWDIDAVILGGKVAMERGGAIISKIKQGNDKIKILTIAEDDADKARLLELGSDHFSQKPLSGESVVDKVLMLLTNKYAANS